MATVIEFAEKRIEEEAKANCDGADNSHVISYWAAYLDGAKAQLKECETFRKKSDNIVATVECKTVSFIKDVISFADDMDKLFTDYLEAHKEIETLFEKETNDKTREIYANEEL